MNIRSRRVRSRANPEIINLAEELEKVDRAEAGDLLLQTLSRSGKRKNEKRATNVISSSSKDTVSFYAEPTRILG
jgi:hypothetical protein